MNFTAIKETCIYATDLEKIKAFYADKLGLPVINYVEGKHIFFRAGRSVLLCFNPDDSALKKSPPPHYASGKIHFAFEVRDREYEQVRSQCLQQGIEITEELTWPSGKKSFYFEDPTGNVLEIVPDTGIWD
jgi:catechol 2,3-dioxygenase-like lactoylglutathione lyase family enzyme